MSRRQEFGSGAICHRDCLHKSVSLAPLFNAASFAFRPSPGSRPRHLLRNWLASWVFVY